MSTQRPDSTPNPPPRQAPEPAAAGLGDLSGRVREITRANAQLFDALLQGERRFRRIARAVWRVQEEERRRLARELHDGIGQTLTALKNQLEYLGSRDPERLDLEHEIGAAVELAAEALADTRELSRLLRPPVLDELGLEPALRWLSRRLRERAGLSVELDCAETDGRLESEYETLVFRVVQESLTNVVKHAGVDRASVLMRSDGDGVRLEIADRGKGFEVASILEAEREAPGFGLRGIADRVELFGGTVRFDSTPGSGTTIRVSLPGARRREG